MTTKTHRVTKELSTYLKLVAEFPFPVTKEVWDHRRKAILNVDLYHQGQQEISISRASEFAARSATQAPPVSPPTH